MNTSALFNAKPTAERYGKTHPWVPDGIYDSRKFQTRYFIKDGRAQEVVTVIWLQSNRLSELSPAMQANFGTYPDLPEKPKS